VAYYSCSNHDSYLIDLAVNRGNIRIVKLLLNHGADVTPNALAYSIINKYSNIESVLLPASKSKGIDFDYSLVFKIFIDKKDEDAFNHLIANGVDPKVTGEDGENLLFYAVRKHNIKFCKKLIKTHGLTVKHRNKQGLSALEYATCKYSPKIVKILLSHGADPKALTACHLIEGGTAKDISVIMQLFQQDYQDSHTEIVNIINQLVAAGADINHQDSEGNTALHYAAKFAAKHYRDPFANKFEEELTAVIVALLNAGADKNLKNNEGVAPKDGVKGTEFERIFGIKKERGIIEATLNPVLAQPFRWQLPKLR